MNNSKIVTYNIIDILKFFFAICVVAIHTNIMDGSNNFEWIFMHGIFRLAVPFFFVCTGFFLGLRVLKNKEEVKDIVIKYIKRLSIPLIFWGTLNYPYYIYQDYVNGYSLKKIIGKTIQSLLFYPRGAFWYVSATIVAIIIIYFLIKKDKFNKAIIISGFLYCFALIANNYYFIIKDTPIQKLVDLYIKIFMSPRNGIFVGFLFVSIGFHIAELKINNKLNKRKSLMIAIISYFLLLVEIMVIKDKAHIDDRGLFIMLPIFIANFVIVIINIKIKDRVIYRKLRNLSTGIYYTHAFIINILILIINTSNYILFLITCSISISIYYILQKSKNKFITKIIN